MSISHSHVNNALSGQKRGACLIHIQLAKACLANRVDFIEVILGKTLIPLQLMGN